MLEKRSLTHKENIQQRKAGIAKKMNTDQILMYSANGGNGSMYDNSQMDVNEEFDDIEFTENLS